MGASRSEGWGVGVPITKYSDLPSSVSAARNKYCQEEEWRRLQALQELQLAAVGMSGRERESSSAEAAQQEEGFLVPHVGVPPYHGGTEDTDPLQGRRVLREWQADASLIRSGPLDDLPLVFVPLVRRVGADGPADVLTVDISLEPPRREIIAVVFEDVQDACALVALLGHTTGFTTADGVQRSVVGMPPQTAAENAEKAGAEIVCYCTGFAAKARVRVGCELRDVLDAMAGARRAAQIEELRSRGTDSK
jgi:hypothetical protein